MAITTRAAANPLPIGANDDRGYEAHNQMPGEAQTSKDFEITRKSRLGFLDLPPEIRNRIYEYAVNIYNEHTLLIRSKCYKNPHLGSELCTSRAFFGLTQACKRVRAEFRPLWLASSTVQIRFDDMNAFFHTYYPKGLSDSQNALKLLELEVDHRNKFYYGDPIDITLICQIRAHTRSSKVIFQYWPLYKDSEGGEEISDICKECGGFVDEEPLRWCSYHDEACFIWDNAYAQAKRECEDLAILNSFIQHDDERWLEEIREGRITKVEVSSHGYDYPHLFFRIRYSRHCTGESRALCKWDLCEDICDCGISLFKTHYWEHVGFIERRWFRMSSCKVSVEDEKIAFVRDWALDWDENED